MPLIAIPDLIGLRHSKHKMALDQYAESPYPWPKVGNWISLICQLESM